MNTAKFLYLKHHEIASGSFCLLVNSNILPIPVEMGLWSLLLYKNLNHKRLGIYYLLSGFLYGISGTLISVLMRIELFSSGSRIIAPENLNFYNIFITLHGLIMIFFLVMPVLFGGYGNFLIPIFQGSPEVVYPRANNFSILILFLSYFMHF